MGTLLAFQCPQPELLAKLAGLCATHQGNLTRLDISSDAVGSALDNQIFIKEHLLLRHRKAMPIQTFENLTGGEGAIYCPVEAPRNVAVYADYPSKLDQKGPNVAKFDLRLRGRAKLVDHNSLIWLNPRDLILKHVRFVDFDRHQFERRTFKEVREKDPEQAKAQIAKLKRHAQFDFVQRAHDFAPHVRLNTNNALVCFQQELTWGAKRRSIAKKDLSSEINMVREDNA
ncbi:hypothetical protein WHZ78_01745 [Bradyrhizobium symbiodeficiens]|uniref:hypothetical protein n=1 Tax=Bradyrhizobium symbiodeficiens TaxID=1404367 RepID=UPI0030D5EEF5